MDDFNLNFVYLNKLELISSFKKYLENKFSRNMIFLQNFYVDFLRDPLAFYLTCITITIVWSFYWYFLQREFENFA